MIYYNIDTREFNRTTTAEEAAQGNNFKDKVIIVTGSSGGIGIPTTTILTQYNATVIMACRNTQKANMKCVVFLRNKVGLKKMLFQSVF